MSLQSDKKMSDIPSHVDAKADDAASAAATSQAETATKASGMKIVVEALEAKCWWSEYFK